MEKVAVIDLGSNTARVIIANVMESGYFYIIDELKDNIRLGQDLEKDGNFLKPARIAQTINTLKMFRKICDVHKVDKIFAYATAAVRAARNQKGFLDEIEVTCGIKLQILTPEEEAQLVYIGAVNTMDVPRGLIVDIGGSSTELICYYRRNLWAQTTLPFGAITLTDLFKDGNFKPEERMQKIKDYVTERLKKIQWLKQVEPDVQLVGVGGSFRNLGKISRQTSNYPIEIVHNYRISSQSFDSIYENIRHLNIDESKRIKGLSLQRADIFPSAIGAIKAIMEYMNFKEIIFSGNGLREGALLRYTMPSTIEKPINDVLGYSLNNILYTHGANVTHAEHVTNIALQLFKQLKVLHKLPRMYVKVLRVAAMLHDIGNNVKYHRHNHHSCYYILNSNIYGIAHRDIVMAAYVAACEKKSDININELIKYKDLLVEEDIEAIYMLGIILRLAESFDRCLNGAITGIVCDILGDSVIMKTESEADCSLEIKEASLACGEFKRAFKKNLEIL